MVAAVTDEEAPDLPPRRLVHHTPLKRWSPITKAERRSARRFVDRLVEMPYFTAATTALLVWFYLVQLVFDWPPAFLFPDITTLADDLAMHAVGHRMGWLDPDLVRAGETWRLISSTFVHASLLHILGNCVVLFFLGRIVENAIGRSAFVLTYVGAAVTGGLFSMWLVDGISHGASGAALGMLGAAAAFGIRYRDSIPKALKHYFGIDLWFFIGLVALLSFVPNVDWAGHLGGFLFGLVMGASWQARMFVPEPAPVNLAMRVGLGGLAAASLVGTALLVGLNIATMNDFLPGDDVRALAIAEERGDTERMLEVSERLLERFPDHPSTARIRIAILGMADRWDEALALALDLGIDNEETRRFLIGVLGGAGQWGAALEQMELLERESPRVVEQTAWNNDFAWSLFMARPDDPDAVKQGLKRVRKDLQKDPENRAYLNTLAYGLYLDGKVLQAERKVAELMVGRSIAKARDDVFLHVLTLLGLGRDEDALAEYTEAVGIIEEGGALREEATAALAARGLVPSPSPEPKPPESALPGPAPVE